MLGFIREKNYKRLLFVLILILAAVLRFYNLGNVPAGFYQDESSIGYNAYSILQTGKDEYGKSFPLYFKSFGDHKLPVYVYSTVPSVALFGMTEFAVRLPSALASLLTIPIFYILIKRLSKNDNLALLSAFLLSINPWHIHYARATFEVSISLLLLISALTIITYKRTFLNILLATLLFGLCIYTYNLTRLLAPILYIATLWFYKSDIRKQKKLYLGLIVVANVLILLPLIYTFTSSGGISSASGTLIHSSAVVQSRLLELRMNLIGVPDIFTKLFFNYFILTFWQYVQNIVAYLSPRFFFISGSTHGNHGVGYIGQFYLWEAFTIPLGLGLMFLKNRKWSSVFLIWGILTILVASLTRESPHSTRSFFLIPTMVIASALGLKIIYSSISNKIKRYAFLLFSVLIISFSLIQYLMIYYFVFPHTYAPQWRQQDKEVVEIIKSQNPDKVIIDPKAGLIYSSILFYTQLPPEEFQATVKRMPDDNEGFSEVISFGKYEYRTPDWEQDLKAGNLIITKDSPDSLSKNVLYYPQISDAFADKNRIISLPIKEKAYEIIIP